MYRTGCTTSGEGHCDDEVEQTFRSVAVPRRPGRSQRQRRGALLMVFGLPDTENWLAMYRGYIISVSEAARSW